MHNKSTGCGASGAYALGPDEKKKNVKSKFNLRQHGFIKYNSTTTNLFAYLDFFTPLFHSHRQVDAIYFDFSNVFDLIPHVLLLRELDDVGLTPAYFFVSMVS